MKYLLFINFNSGLMHNRGYKTLRDVIESIKQLIDDEGLNVKKEKLLNICELKKHLNSQDDYFGQLSNGTWFHIQPQDVFKVIK